MLFWDVDIDALNMEKDSSFIISRILEEGTFDDNKWLFQTYSKSQIVSTITSSKLISKLTANFWQKVLNIQEPIRCLQISSQNTLSKRWKK